ncbi:MAG: hypothetical protein R3272_14505 [Candidatus Promineifilaceae bacterium]|nr:hypothetical protein [Candidatus Promineifilaceae bacterium]
MMNSRFRLAGIAAALLLLVLLTGVAFADAEKTTFEWIEVGCAITPGQVWQSGNVLHVRDEVHTAIVLSDEPLLRGTNTIVSNVNLNLKNGTGTGYGTLRAELDAVDGAWEGRWSFQIEDGLFEGRAVSEGTGELRGKRLHSTFEQIPLSELDENPCPGAPVGAHAVRGVMLEPASN